MKVKDDGRCSYHADQPSSKPLAEKRCKHATDVRCVLTLFGAGVLECLLPFGMCSEHSEIIARIVETEDFATLCKLPGVMKSVASFQDRFGEDPANVSITLVGVDTEELQNLLKIGHASDANGAAAPVIVEHARADDVKADLGEQKYKETFGKS